MGRSTGDEARERMGQLELLRARRFGPFFWTQFLGALNDNLFKNALVILFAFRMGGVVFSENTLVNLSTGLLTLPFFLFSASAGQIADKFDKSRIIRLVKLCESGIMLLGAGGLPRRGVLPAPAPAADLRLDWNPLRETLRIVGFARENRTVFLSILGISWFWFYGALFLAQFPGLTRDVLGGDEWVAMLLLVVFSVGVALGC